MGKKFTDASYGDLVAYEGTFTLIGYDLSEGAAEDQTKRLALSDLVAMFPLQSVTAITSAQLAAIISNETGTGLAVFNDTPTLATPNFTGVPTGTIMNGTYTPTPTNVANCAGFTAQVTSYFRIGNMVTVFGYIIVTTTAAVSTLFTLTLPIATTFAAAENAGGCGALIALTEVYGVYANAGAGTVSVRGIALSGAARNIYFQFSYRVI